MTIVIAPGTYMLSSSLYLNGLSDVTIRGGTNSRDDVVLVGPGMTNASYGDVPYGIWTGNVQGVTIANLTIRDVYYHPIIFNAGTQSPRVYNVHLINAGQQFIKSNPDDAGGGVNNGIVEYSVIEYVTTAKDDYTNGVDVHTGANWIIRHNLFRNIVALSGLLAGPSVLMWNHSSNTITEGNAFVNCARGIAYGLQEIPGFDHRGGIIRNNTFFRASAQPGDVAISVADSPQTQVVNNTVYTSGTYDTPIEFRFAETTGTLIANNITDGVISAREGATGTLLTNIERASASLFVNAAAGDLHLSTLATSAIDSGTTVSSVTDDWDGQPRPQGAAFDIGADEVSGRSVGARSPRDFIATLGVNTVSFVWMAPESSDVAGYVIEAGMTSGWIGTNVAAILINNTVPFCTVSLVGVAPGTYYVRVRAVNSSNQVSDPSNEQAVPVGTPTASSPKHRDLPFRQFRPLLATQHRASGTLQTRPPVR
jgi:hypothetical protein